MADDTLTITDNRTGKQYDVPIENGVIRAMDLRKIKVSDDDFGLMSYDPAFTNTASCRSTITFIDGDKGILRYRGYPIEQLAEHSTYLEVAYLLIHGELPTPGQLKEWSWNITHHTFIHEQIKKSMDGFRSEAQHLSRGCVLAHSRGAANAGPVERMVLEHNSPYVHSRTDQKIHGWVPLRCSSDGDAYWDRRRSLDLLQRCQGCLQPRGSPPSNLPAHCQDAYAGSVRISPQRWNAV